MGLLGEMVVENYWVRFSHTVYVSADCKAEAALLGKEAYNKALGEDPESLKVCPEIEGPVYSMSVDEAMKLMVCVEAGPIVVIG